MDTCLNSSLHQLQDFLASLDNFPFNDEPAHQYNYISQLFYEFGYYCSPPSVQSLRSVFIFALE